jgi:RNA polymerase sigma-70 factor (ECF subfamily)
MPRPAECRTAPAAVDRFESVVLPHFDAGHRLARWLTRNEQDAEDVVQEAALRAFRYYRTFSGGSARAWFLRIVRTTWWDWRERRLRAAADPFDEEHHSGGGDPEALAHRIDQEMLIDRAMRTLPDRFRELIVLRELEGLSYRELADVLDVPMGTVMSGLSRARSAFRGAVTRELAGVDHRPGQSI